VYKVGEVVIFNKEGLKIGIVEGYHKDNGTYWYNIRVSKDLIYSYTNHGDAAEFDILAKIDDDTLKENCLDIILDRDE
jgi:hypothetical protein